MKKIIVVNNPKDWKFHVPEVDVVSAKDYLTKTDYTTMRSIRVFNLCKDYSYQSKGYYVSLLAEARGHKVIPNVKSIRDFKAPAVVKIISDEIDDLIQKSFKKLTGTDFELSIYFGQNVSPQYLELSQELYRLFQAPLLRAHFVFKQKWFIQSIRPICVNEIPDAHLDMVDKFARDYFDKNRFVSAHSEEYLYDLAILINPDEKEPPSNPKAIQKFINAAEKTGFRVELITKKDYHRVGEFDALFIRETTNVNHHTYAFARRAQSEGIAVIDDPDSILRCSNKVYLQELMNVGKIPAPHTIIAHSENRHTLAREIGFPMILKAPDSSFSLGVVKVQNSEELQNELDKMLEKSDLIIAQEFIPTKFDWRIGILDGKPFYACKYYMAKDHWQIYNWNSKDKDDICGLYDCLPLEQVPHGIIKAALRISSMIGNGLYGVDLKEVNGKPMVIEVNDNPSIDDNVEDQIGGEKLYLNIMHSLRRRIEDRLNAAQQRIQHQHGIDYYL
ncbi:MAG: RimK family protein [Fibrobacteraceae bacterium]|nr:RimK family protein [Fibrobacteraceae bacterium]